jgi:hypothetical protein
MEFWNGYTCRTYQILAYDPSQPFPCSSMVSLSQVVDPIVEESSGRGHIKLKLPKPLLDKLVPSTEISDSTSTLSRHTSRPIQPLACTYLNRRTYQPLCCSRHLHALRVSASPESTHRLPRLRSRISRIKLLSHIWCESSGRALRAVRSHRLVLSTARTDSGTA